MNYRRNIFYVSIIFFLFTVVLTSFISGCAKKETKTETVSGDSSATEYSTEDLTYSGIWIKDNTTTWFSFMNYDDDKFTSTNLTYPDYRIIDFEAVNVGNDIRYTVIYIKDGTSDSYCLRCDADKIESHTEYMKNYKVMPIDYERHYENGEWYYTIIWESSEYGNGGSYGWSLRYSHDKNNFLNDVKSLDSLGKYPVDIEIHYYGKKYGGAFTSKPSNYLFFWELNYADIVSNINDAKSSGYSPVDIEIYEIEGVKKYAGVLTLDSNEWDYVLDVSPEEFSQKNTLMQNSGYRPIDYEVHTSEERNIGRISKRYIHNLINYEHGIDHLTLK